MSALMGGGKGGGRGLQKAMKRSLKEVWVQNGGNERIAGGKGSGVTGVPGGYVCMCVWARHEGRWEAQALEACGKGACLRERYSKARVREKEHSPWHESAGGKGD
jgi:hypothetical protein